MVNSVHMQSWLMEGAAMTDEEVFRYLELANRKSFILLHSGASWEPEYAAELEDRELTVLRGIIDRMHEQKEVVLCARIQL